MIKNNRGVALATLVIAVIVMLAITGTITYTSLDTMKLRKLDDMYNDIRLLNQKVTNYYIDNNKLPVLETVISKTDLPEEIKNSNPNDSYEYRIIDLEKLGGITLKYGKEYKEYDTNKTDVYIINEVSHTIYYLKGIKINEEGINVEKYALDETYVKIDNINLLPSGYQKVEYIESTGYDSVTRKAKQYLEIDYIASGTTKSKGKYQITDEKVAGFLFGSRGESGSLFYGFNWGGGQPYKYYNSYKEGLLTTLEIDEQVHTFYKDKGVLYIDDTYIQARSDTNFTTPYKMNVFACNDNDNIGYLAPYVRIFYLQFYDNDTLMVDLVPCRCTYDNKLGMYDVVNKRFYKSLGPEEFIAGNNI